MARGSAGRIAAAGDLHGREGELDPVGIEGLLDHRQRLAADDELLARLRHHLEPDLYGEVAKLLDALHLQRLEDMGGEQRILEQLLTDLLDQLARLLE